MTTDFCTDLDTIGHLDFEPECEIGVFDETGQPCGDEPVCVVAYHHTCCDWRDGGHCCADCLSMLREQAAGESRVGETYCLNCDRTDGLVVIDRIEPLR